MSRSRRPTDKPPEPAEPTEPLEPAEPTEPAEPEGSDDGAGSRAVTSEASVVPDDSSGSVKSEASVIVSEASIVESEAVATAASDEPEASPASDLDDPEAPILPATASEDDLHEAIGASPKRGRPSRVRRPESLASEPVRATTDDESRDDDDDDDDHDDDARGARKSRPRSRKTIIVSAISIVVGLSVGAFVFLGRANSAHYAISCRPENVVAEQGRTFPPWGTRSMSGAEWKPIAIPPEAECVERETDDVSELSGWFLDTLVAQASVQLKAREVTKVDLAEQQLKQALLLARAPEKKDQREGIKQLLGDVGYWRASAKLKEAAAALLDAAKQFDDAAAQKPLHVRDASAWANYLRKLVDELHLGPDGKTAPAVFPPTPPIASERPVAPPGTALPIEPDGAGSGSDRAPVTAAPPDAGVPSGGVLL